MRKSELINEKGPKIKNKRSKSSGNKKNQRINRA